MKLNIVKPLLLIALSTIIILNSCQVQQKGKKQNQTDTLAIIETHSPDEIGQAQDDTLTIDDRFVKDNKQRSHIELDFAKININVRDTSMVRIVDTICAISIIPDTSWINQKQNEAGDSWEEIVSDKQYYEVLAIDTLKYHVIQTYYAPREKRYISFVKEDNSYFTIDLNKMKDAWGLILFNTKDNPVFWSSTKIDDELYEIYGKYEDVVIECNDVKTDNLVSLGILSASEDSIFRNLVNDSYERFINCSALISEYKDLDNMGMKVNTGAVRGLFTSMESIFMKDSLKHFCAAVIEDEKVLYFSNIASYKNQIPKTIDNWRSRFSDYEIIYKSK